MTVNDNATFDVSDHTFTNNGTLRFNMGSSMTGATPSGKVEYQTLWDTDGNGTVDASDYTAEGAIPTHEAAEKPMTNTTVYTFDRWDPIPSQIQAPTKFTAQFTESARKYNVSLSSGQGYVIHYQGENSVEYNTQIEFTVEILPGFEYTGWGDMVTVNGQPLSADTQGIYRYTITSDTAIAVTGVNDWIYPEGDITFQDESVAVDDIWALQKLDRFFNKDVKIKITGSDEGRELKSIEYFRSTEILDYFDVMFEEQNWTPYTGPITEHAVDGTSFVYYVRLTDLANNETYLCAGATFDTTAPVISGVETGKIYYTTQNVTVSDENLQSVTVNGDGAEDASSITLSGNMDKTYSIVATDKAGNTTKYTVTMKPIASLADPIKDLTENNVTSSHKTTIEAVQAAVNAVEQTTATDEEKTELQEILDNCNALLTKISLVKEEMDALTEAVGALEETPLTSSQKDTVNNLLTRVENLLNSGNLTPEETTQMEAPQGTLTVLKNKLDEFLQAENTESMDKVENITSENVKPEDKEDLTAAKEDIETALENFGDNYTEEEKAELQDKLDKINSALESLEKVETVQDAIAALPESVEPDDTDSEALIDAAKELYDALTEHEKSLVSEELKSKLESLLGNLVDYQIIKGNGIQWTMGDDGSLTITANGPVAKFLGIQVDGVDVAAENYSVKSGSTIITLKPTYLDTLSAGKHTLTVLYTDGRADGVFEILEKVETNVPETGNNSNIFLCFIPMLVAVCGMTSIIMYSRRKKYSK